MSVASQVPLASLRLHTFDPLLHARMNVFAPLRLRHVRAFPAAVSSAREFRRVLARITGTERAAACDARPGMGGEGEEAESLRGDTFHVVVVLDYPEGVDEQVQAELLRLAGPDGPAGVLVVVQHDATRRPADPDVRPDALAALLDEVAPPGRAGEP
ncbi:hypothetical protein ACFP3Q_17985 [Nocardioides sp. GCM10027113]|uniref:hypothetical protein n=1 Tax=unclassified Nocardioides TaxID=2615069 RepID=UPI003610A465